MDLDLLIVPGFAIVNMGMTQSNVVTLSPVTSIIVTSQEVN